jgi:hypothetical protein
MASIPPPTDATRAYDEAEQGTQDFHSRPTTSSAESAPTLIDEKVVDGGEAKPPVVIPSELVPVTPSKPPSKKVSKWILWTLWFNTYRWVSIMSTSLVSDFASGPTR